MVVLLAAAAWPAAGMSGAILPSAPAWSPCPTGEPPVECSWFEVPLDHAHPDSPTVRLAVRRLPAVDPRRRLGVLIVLAGGPGQRGTDLVRTEAHLQVLHERFDIVGWDPRGTSGETHIDCMPQWDPFPGLDRTTDTDEERRLLDAHVAELADRCRRRHGPILPFLGRLDSVGDLELLRQELGEERISLLASSSGAQVALLYALQHPDRVRAAILDGLSDPFLSPDALDLGQAAAFERELDGLLAGCADDDACPFRNAGRPQAALDRLLERLDGGPIPAATGTDAPATEADAYEAILGSLVLGAGARASLLRALAAAQAGDGGPLARIAASIRLAFESSGLDQGTYMASYCADAAPFWRSLSAEQVLGITRRMARVAPRLGRWLWSPPAAEDLPPVGLCAMTPAVARPPAPEVDPGANVPTLVLGTTGDPTTPIDGARRASRRLSGATFLVLDGDYHLAYSVAVRDPGRPAHDCILEAVANHLLLLAPPRVTVCRDTSGQTRPIRTRR